ncbi:hypothetical protein NQ176_g5689 [Zarea fungicola]|uniref:Uncharacterized protein n=1 Tax=Zarea fungicola TaxID=93591 RepID=A0ACC1N9H0_9HYPO|nr:hypothetical protein NQ176_g5689 [Lecanicillium fungicola]
MGSLTTADLPVKTREVQNHHSDSTIWNDFPFRNDDIIITTYAKSGTTWMQQIVGQLTQGASPTLSVGELSPWVDLRVVPRNEMLQMLESQQHRRFIKTHLPVDGLTWSPDVKYLYVARDARDMIWSLHHHFTVATPVFWNIINETPGLVGPPMAHPPKDPRDLFLDLLEDDTRTTIPWPYWSHTRSWWAVRNQPNVLFVHFADLKKDLEGEMRRIAKFLDISNLSDDEWKAAVEHSTFAWMKEHAELPSPGLVDQVFDGGAQSFINKGSNNRWADVLSEEDNKRYLEKAKEELGEECANWLVNGGHLA